MSLRRRTIVVVTAGLAAAATGVGLWAAGITTRTPVSRAAATASPDLAAVGALYPSRGATRHACTASVVDSRHGDTLITAAHCVSGTGSGMTFVPDQHGRRRPDGRWIVIAAHLASRWITRQDPHDDVAFLTVAPRLIHGVRTTIQRVTGGNRLGATAMPHQRVRVIGYPAGTTNQPIQCTATIELTEGFPTFNCPGFVSGTSGSPWLRVTDQGVRIVGVIGGLNQGGCSDATSYSSPLGRDAHRAYRHASRHEPADVAPRPHGDGC